MYLTYEIGTCKSCVGVSCTSISAFNHPITEWEICTRQAGHEEMGRKAIGRLCGHSSSGAKSKSGGRGEERS
jgi:hypothetical protein